MLNAICREAKSAGKLSGSNLTELYELFGSRFTKALDARALHSISNMTRSGSPNIII